MPGPGQRVKYPRGLRRWKKNKKSKSQMKERLSSRPRRDNDAMFPEGPRGGGTGGGGRIPPWGGAKGGRVGKSSGGSVSSRLSKAGPVGKAN